MATYRIEVYNYSYLQQICIIKNSEYMYGYDDITDMIQGVMCIHKKISSV